MMAQTMSGLQRSDAAGPQAALLAPSGRGPVPQADFAVLLKQSTDAAILENALPSSTLQAMSTRSLLKHKEDLPNSTEHLKALVGQPVIGISRLRIAVGVKKVLSLAKDFIAESASVIASESSITKTSTASSQNNLQVAVKSVVPHVEQQNSSLLAATVAVTSFQKNLLDLTLGQKISTGIVVSNSIVKLAGKNSKTTTKQVPSTVNVEANRLIVNGETPLNLREKALPSATPPGLQSLTAPVQQKSSLKAIPLLHDGAVMSGMGASVQVSQRNESLLKAEISSIDPPMTTQVQAATTSDKTSGNLIVLPPASVEVSGTLTGVVMFTALLHPAAQTSLVSEDPGVVVPTNQRETSPNASIAGHAQEGFLPHTLLTATPTTLEVGVSGGTRGWLKIRAELTRTGEVTASLSGASPATASVLRSELPALNSYLVAEKIQVGALSVHTMLSPASDVSDNTASLKDGRTSDLLGDLNGGASNGSAPHEGSKQAAATPDLGEEATETKPDAGPVTDAYESGTRLGDGRTLSPVKYGAEGSWLNVRA